MKLIVVRHGETDLNKVNRLQGSKGPNEGLNVEGKKVVALLQKTLHEVPDIIYASPLKRTMETATILNERFSVPLTIAPDLMERDFGALSGELRTAIDPKLIEADLEGHYDYRPYGGESITQVKERVKNFIDRIRMKPEEVVMLVTHRGVIRILYDLYPNGVIGDNIIPGSTHIFTLPD